MKMDYLYKLRNGYVAKVIEIINISIYPVRLQIIGDIQITTTRDGKNNFTGISEFDIKEEIGYYKDYPEYFL